ncbi:hypothetical protein [Cellulomonas hominis]
MTGRVPAGVSVSGLGAAPARWALLAVWATGLGQMALAVEPRPAAVVAAVGLAMTLLGSLLVSTPGPDQLTPGRAVLVAAVPVVNTLLLLGPVAEVGGGLWLISIGTYLAGLLMVRGHVWLGWSGGGTTLVLVVLWAGWRGSWADELTPVLANAVVALVVGTVWHLLVGRTVTQLRGHRRVEAQAEMQESVTREAVVRRLAEVREIERRVGPLLDRIATGAALDDAEREACRLLEAELRDRLRAPSLAVSPVLEASQDARRRGVDVLLLDDGGHAAGLSGAVLARVAAAVRGAGAGRVTVRVLPPGRGPVATVLVDDGVDPVLTSLPRGAD